MIPNLFCKRKLIFPDFTGAYYQRLEQFLPGYIILLCLIFGLTHQCLAQCSIYFYPGNKPGFGDPNNYAASMPVVVSNWLYLYTYTQGKTNYCLWRTHPNELPADPNSLASFDANGSWSAIDITGIYNPVTDPNAKFTALCSYKDCLYIAVKNNQGPYLWRPEDAALEDPNNVKWYSVAPNDLTSGTINALYVFNDYLYMGVINTGTSEGTEVALWRSIESGDYQLSSTYWKSIDCRQLNDSDNTIISSFQGVGNKLYLGTENSLKKCEVWGLNKEANYPDTLIKEHSWGSENRRIAAMAVAGDVLYAVTRNNEGSQLWYYKENESKFLEAPSGMRQQDPNQTSPLSMESLGSYLFLGFDTDEIRRLISWDSAKSVSALNDANHSLYDTNQPILDNDTHLCWIYADKPNGHLYLGTKNTTESDTKGFTLWKSSRLPVIAVTSPKPPYNAFHEGNLEAKWKTTKGGYYIINLTEFKNPSGFEDPNINKYFPLCIDPNRNAQPAHSLTTTLIASSDLEIEENQAREGTYIIEISWDPNRNPITKDKETYPVRFSFKYDTTPPSIPSLIDVSAGNEKLRVQWTEAIDTLSGVAEYKMYWEPIEDPNMEAFSGQYSSAVINESNYTITQANGQQYPEYIIYQLVNNQYYRMAISAIDYANNESDKSLELFGAPEPGRGLTDLLGETGGCFLNILYN